MVGKVEGGSMWERQALLGFTWECWEGDGVDWCLTLLWYQKGEWAWGGDGLGMVLGGLGCVDWVLDLVFYNNNERVRLVL